MKWLLRLIQGMAVGIANIIPGVSGGTMAVVLGIYERLTESIGEFFFNKEKRREYFVFLFFIIIGAGIGVLLFARIFTLLFTDAVTRFPTYLFFIGLIAGSIPTVFRIHGDMRPSIIRAIMLLLGIAGVLATYTLKGSGEAAIELEVISKLPAGITITSISPGYAVWLVFCGFAAAGSMIIPGFSGSALLISLGEYHNIIAFLDGRMIIPLGFLILGIIPGVLFIAKIIHFVLERYPAPTFYFITGLLIGSMGQIGMEAQPDFRCASLPIIIGLTAVIIGYALSAFLGRKPSDKNKS